MPKRHLASQLPKPLLEELETRLKNNNHSDFSSLSDWLKEKGYSILKSALFNYSRKMRKLESASADDDHARDIGLRMRCLEVAVRVPRTIDVIDSARAAFKIDVNALQDVKRFRLIE